MNSIVRCLFTAFVLATCGATGAQQSVLRIVCEGENRGAEVSVNGKFKGECPVNVPVAPGTSKLRFKKGDREQALEVRLGDDVMKTIDVLLPLSPEAQQRIDGRVAGEELRREQALWQQAMTGDDALKVQAYIDTYPNGSNVAAARMKLAAIREARANIKAKLTVFRNRQLSGSLDTSHISIDGEKVGTLSDGSSLSVDLPAGTHLLKASYYFFGSVVNGCEIPLSIDGGSTYRYLLAMDPCRFISK